MFFQIVSKLTTKGFLIPIRISRRGFKFSYAHTCSTLNQETSNTSSSDENTFDSSNNVTDVKLQILNSSLNFISVHGWSKKTLALGAESIGFSSSSHNLIQGGVAELVHYFNFSCMNKLEVLLNELHHSEKRVDVQTYIEKALEERLKMNIPYLSTWPSALSQVASPVEAATDLKNTLDLADLVWRGAGDQSVGFSWYSRRLSLAAIYRMCELSLLQDSSPDYADTFDLVHRQVESYMEITHSLENLPVLAELGATAVGSFLRLNQCTRK